MLDVTFPIAFWAGLISFFAPCAIPLFPAYIAYISGYSAEHLRNTTGIKFKRRLLFANLVYILGFSLTFVVLGTSIAGLGIVLRRHADIVRIFGGIIISIFGLELTRKINIPLFNRGGIVKLPEWSNKLGIMRPFLIGVVFATTWAPCVGPILGTILALSFLENTLFKGAMLLFTYSVGISMPFIIASITVGSFQKYMHINISKLEKISILSGYLMLILGILLVTNTLRYVNMFLVELF